MRKPQTVLRRFLGLTTRGRSKPTTRLRLVQLESRLVPAVSLLNHFDGLVSGSPPDTCGAAGPNSYIETVNAAICIYNKSTNAVIASDGLYDFLYTKGGLTPVGGALDDATMIWDEPIGRFIVAELDTNGPNSGPSALNIAVSKNSNPTTLDPSSWYFLHIDASEANEWADYPGNLGYNADALVYTFNMFPTNGSGNYHTRVTALSQPVLASGQIDGWAYDEQGVSLRPVTMHDSAAGGPMWFVTEGGNGRSINLNRMDNLLSGSPSFSIYNIAVNSYGAINPPLNPDGTTITTNIDTRIMKAAERNNQIVACQAVGVGNNEDDACWYEFDVSNINSPFLVQECNVGFGPNTYTVYPAIDINPAGDIAMGFTKSGNDYSTDYMSAYITGRKSLYPAGAMEDPVVIKAGDSTNGNGREGDFSGISVDPSDGTFWVADEYTTNNNGATEVANFAMNTQNFTNYGGKLVIIGDQLGTNYSDTLTLSLNGRGGVYAILNGEAVGFDAGQIWSIDVTLGGGNDVIDVESLPFSVYANIHMGSGSDTVDLSEGNGDLSFIQALVNVIGDTTDAGASATVNINDGSDAFGHIYTVDAGSVQRDGVTYLQYTGVQQITLQGSSGTDWFMIESTASGTPVTVNTGTGNDSIDVCPTLKNLDYLPGNLTVNGQGGSDGLFVDDRNNSNIIMTQDWLTGGSLGRLGSTINPFNGQPLYHGAGITYSGIQAFTFDAGGVPNEVFMDGTSTATNVNASPTTVLMEVNEAGNLDSIAGTLTVQGNGAIPLIVNDQHNTDLYTQDTLTVSNLFRLGLGYIPGTAILTSYPASINYSGFNGLAINLGANLASFQVVSTAIGTPVSLQGSGAGGLIGPNMTNTWSLTGVNTGTVGNVSFTGLPYLQGGTGVDTFKFASSAASIVGINGGGGKADQLDYSALAGPITINLQTLAAPFINGGAAGGFSNIQSFVGSGSSSDMLIGPNATTTWAISSANGGKVGTTSFTGFEDLVGGSGNDAFKFSGAGSVSGTINGGGGTANKLDYSALAGPVTVNLQTSSAPLISSGAAGGFSNLQAFVGSQSTADTLIGPNATTTWTISTANAGKAGNVGFSGFENLQGGTGLNVFKFTGSGSLAGSVNGGSAPSHQGNWLDYSSLGTAVTVNLQTGMAIRVAGGVSNIQNVHGSNYGSTLTGNSQGNILIGGTGSDTITGGPGVSLLIGDKGADHVNGGSGGDMLIGDYTTYDSMSTAHQDALMAILAEWQSADSYATRFHDINTGTGGGLNGTAKLNFGTTVLDDGVADTLTAAASTQALDWFFQGAGDTLLNKETGEHVNNT